MVMFVSLSYPRLMPILRHRTSSLIIHIFHPHSHLSLHVPLDQDIYQERFCKKKGKQDNSSTKRQAATRAMATDLFAIAVDADDYATTAANDVHRVITTRIDGGEVEEEKDEEEDDDDEKDDDEKEEGETQSRTFQSEEIFQLQRKNYSAKMYGHHHHHHHQHPSRRCGLFEEFQLEVFPGFDGGSKSVEGYGNGKEEKEEEGDVKEKEKIQLSKSQIQFLGQVIGELYFEEEFEKLLGFCGRVRRRCCCFLGRDGQKGLEERLSRWEGRSLERLGRRRSGEGEGGLG